MDRLARNLDDLRKLVQQLTQRGVYEGRARTLSGDEITKLSQRAEAGEPKAMLAREFGISRDTSYRYLKPAPLDQRV